MHVNRIISWFVACHVTQKDTALSTNGARALAPHKQQVATNSWWFWHVMILTRDASDTWWFWHVMILTRDDSDMWWFWHVMILTRDDSDTWWFWHVMILTLDDSDMWWFWHVMILTRDDSDTREQVASIHSHACMYTWLVMPTMMMLIGREDDCTIASVVCSRSVCMYDQECEHWDIQNLQIHDSCIFGTYTRRSSASTMRCSRYQGWLIRMRIEYVCSACSLRGIHIVRLWPLHLGFHVHAYLAYKCKLYMPKYMYEITSHIPFSFSKLKSFSSCRYMSIYIHEHFRVLNMSKYMFDPYIHTQQYKICLKVACIDFHIIAVNLGMYVCIWYMHSRVLPSMLPEQKITTTW
jgi:hypothetical protein